jgi:hypothetical protein
MFLIIIMDFDKISNKIYLHFTNKYPNTFQSVGIKEREIKTLLNINQHKLKNPRFINYLIEKIDNEIKKKIYGPNNKVLLNTSQFKIDSQSNINYDTFKNTNFNPLNINKDSNSKLINGQNIESFQNIVNKGVNKMEKMQNQDNTVNCKNSFDVDQLNYQDLLNNSGVLKTHLPNNDINPLQQRQREKDKIESFKNEKSSMVYLVIDSKDRNTEKDKLPNDFEIDLTEKNLRNVKSIELTDCIILKSDKDVQSSDSGVQYPYLLLEIEGISSNMIGSNNVLNNSFAILKNFTEDGDYKYYTELDVDKKFDVPISLSKMRIRFKTPTGELFNFGFINNNNLFTVNLLVFKIKLA